MRESDRQDLNEVMTGPVNGTDQQHMPPTVRHAKTAAAPPRATPAKSA